MTLREVNRVGEGQKNIPKLRFKGYEDAWEQRKLGSDINVTSVKRVHQSDWETEGVPFYRARDIVSEFKGEEISEPIFVSKKTYEEFSRISGKVRADDLLVTGVGTIGVPYLVKSNNPLYFKDGNVIWIQNNKKLDGYFLFYTFITNPIQNFIRESAGTGTVGTLTIETCKRIPVFIPGKREQIAVGEFFQSLDNLITLHQRKYDALKAMKKTLLSKMFPKNGEDIPEIRFKGFTNAWEQRKLGALVQFVNGRAYKQEELLDVGKYKVVRVGNFNTNEKWYFSDLELETDKYIDNGDLLYLWATSFGPVIWQGEKAIFHYHIWKLKNFESLDKKYLYSFLEWDKNKISQNTNGSTMVHITKNMIEQRDIEYPTKSEQYRIGSLLESIDKLITLHQRKLDELKNMKKTLLQQMFV